MPESSPLVSVIMSVYNGEKYLSKAIESILNQSYRNFEFIIVDDASTDSSLEIINEYLKIDNRIIILSNNVNIGLGSSLNKAIQFSSGEFIARMDSDDISIPDRLEKQINYLLEHKNIHILGGDQIIIDERGVVISSLIYPKNELKIHIINALRDTISGVVRGAIAFSDVEIISPKTK